jgi:sirohydrochlorin cobaltochelatase
VTDLVLARVLEVVENHPFPRPPPTAETALFIAGHGTGRDENSRAAVEHQVNLIRSKEMYGEVYPVFLEEDPRIESCYEMAKARSLVMVPFFISDGLHVREDIPILLGEAKALVEQRIKAGHPTWRNPTERRGKRVWYSGSVGTAPQVTDIILARVDEAVAASPHEYTASPDS